jgi:diaminopimelate decarboxylase
MDDFQYRDGQLWCEQTDIDEMARRVGTPAYVYSRRTLLGHYDRIAAAFAELDPVICFSIKSCGNVHICRLLAERGAGMDVVSGGELHRARLAGVPMDKVVYAGVGKTDVEIRDALQAKIGYFNIESEAEFENIAGMAKQMGATSSATLRVNPDVADPKTHEKTTTGKRGNKFGVDIDRARRFFQHYGRDAHLRLDAVHVHIGSPIYSAEPYVQALRKILQLVEQLRGEGHVIRAINIGGGYAADYETGVSPLASDYAAGIVPLLRPFRAGGGRVFLEPGRTITANAGVLLTRVQYIKLGGGRKFVIVDSGFNHLLRVAMYGAFHFIWPTNVAPRHVPEQRREQMDMPGLESCDVVGPICESGDTLARDRMLPPVARGDLLCVYSAGAYGMVMASNYNAMPRPPEVLVDGDRVTIIRRRETYDDLVALEREAVSV